MNDIVDRASRMLAWEVGNGGDMSDRKVPLLPRGGITETLDQRGSIHGDFADNGRIAQSLKEVYRASPNWLNLNPAQREALDLIALKTSRILSRGVDPNYRDNWHDAAGYATLGERNCK